MADDKDKGRSSERKPEAHASEGESVPEVPEPGGAQTEQASSAGSEPEEDDEQFAEADELAGQPDSDPEEGRFTVTRRRLNRVSLGTLTVHYRTRSVGYSMDGDSAMRLLAVLVGHAHDSTLDLIDPGNVSAFRSWVMVDSTEVIGADWNPVPEPSRVAVDPPRSEMAASVSRLIYTGEVLEEDLLGVSVPSPQGPVPADAENQSGSTLAMSG